MRPVSPGYFSADGSYAIVSCEFSGQLLELDVIHQRVVKVFGAAGWAYSSSLATAANKCGAAGANVIFCALSSSLT